MADQEAPTLVPDPANQEEITDDDSALGVVSRSSVCNLKSFQVLFF